MNSSTGVALTGAPPLVASTPPAGLVNPETGPAAQREGPSFEAVLAGCSDTAETPPADNAAPAAPSDSPTASELATAQLAALAALLGLAITPVVTAAPTAPAADTAAPGTEPAAVAALPVDVVATTAASAESPTVDAAPSVDPAAAELTPPAFASVLAALTTAAEATAEADPAADSAQPTVVSGQAAQPVAQSADTSAPEAQSPAVALPKVDPQTTDATTTPDAVTTAAQTRVATAGRAVLEARPTRPTTSSANQTAGEAAVTLNASAAPTVAQSSPILEPARLTEARPVSAALPPETLAAVTQSLVRLVKSGENEMRLQLQPENLGRIELRIAHDADGVRVTMVAQVASTAGLLDQHLDDLRHSLTQAGLSLSGLTVGGGHAQQAFTGGQAGQGGGYQPHTAGGSPLNTPAPLSGPARTAEPAGLVDYWI